jgi:hypothetical protein
MIPAFERAKTVHTSDRAATVVGLQKLNAHEYKDNNQALKARQSYMYLLL